MACLTNHLGFLWPRHSSISQSLFTKKWNVCHWPHLAQMQKSFSGLFKITTHEIDSLPNFYFDWQPYWTHGRPTIKAKLQLSVFIQSLLYHWRFNVFCNKCYLISLAAHWIWKHRSGDTVVFPAMSHLGWRPCLEKATFRTADVNLLSRQFQRNNYLPLLDFNK